MSVYTHDDHLVYGVGNIAEDPLDLDPLDVAQIGQVLRYDLDKIARARLGETTASRIVQTVLALRPVLETIGIHSYTFDAELCHGVFTLSPLIYCSQRSSHVSPLNL